MARLTRLRSKLLLLAVGTLLPVLALAWGLSLALLDHERETARDAAQARIGMFVAAVEAQMEGHVSSLRALASSQALARGDLRTFDAEARRLMPTQTGWMNIMLVAPDGRQRVNMRHEFGRFDIRALATEMPLIERALDTGEPVVGSLTHGPASQRLGIPVRLRVQAGSEGPLVLQFILDPQSLVPLMRTQGYPSSWAYGLADGRGVFIARHPEAAPGARMSADFERALAASPQGWYRGRTIEGRDTYTAYQMSKELGWSAGVAMPAEEVHGAAWAAARIIAVGAAVSLLVAMVFASWLGRRIARPIGFLSQAARKLGRESVAHELHHARSDSRLVEVHEVAAALEEADAALSEREQLRQREQDALRAADKAKDEFLAMLGHELRNPLGAITASAHVLRLSKPDATAAIRAHEVIDRQARQMTRLVEDLMDVSRLAMGKVSLQVERVDLAALAERVVQTWQQAGRSREGRVRLSVAPAWVDGDRARLEQVLANLLDNAQKFSAHGGAIDVRVRAEDGIALMEVADQGDGIAPEDLPRIFELFVQGEQSFHRPQGGIGLGLTLVRRLVELQGGSVTAHSDGRGRGASFVVRLPLAQAEAAVPELVPAAASGTGRRVLLVEDNEDGREMLEAMLGLEGHTVRSVAGGLAAVELAASWTPDVVLVDIGLPDIDGYEVARRIRALPMAQGPRLVAISGYGQPQDQRLAYEAGFDLHLTKPVAPTFLRDVMQALASRQPA